MYQLVASDLDGTLLSVNHTITPYARDILHRLASSGIHIIFATGRHHVDVAQIRDKQALNAWLITSNGARIHNANDQLIYRHDLPQDIVRELCAMTLAEQDISVNLYRDDEWLMDRHRPEELRYFPDAVFHYSVFDPRDFDPQGVGKLFYISDDHHKLLALEQAINARWGQRVNASFSTVSCLEIMAGGVSKGHALETVATALGYDLQHCIAFGDGMNDQQMLQMAGKGCIMGNAHQRLKDVLPDLDIIGDHKDDAVPRYLARLYFPGAG